MVRGVWLAVLVGCSPSAAVATDSGIEDGIGPGCEPGQDQDPPDVPGPNCGDGTVDEGEDCDDGNTTDTDACNNDCRVPGSILLTRRHDNETHGTDSAREVAIDPFGNIVVVGAESRFTQEVGWNTWLRKYTATGAELWTAGYDGPPHDFDSASTLAVLGSGAVVIAGYTNRDDLGQGDNAAIWGYDCSGEQHWMVTYDSPDSENEGVYALALDPSGDLIAVGAEVRYDLKQGTNVFVHRYSAEGELLWRTTHATEGDRNEVPSAVVIDRGAIFVAVGTAVFNQASGDVLLLRYDGSGDLQLDRRLGLERTFPNDLTVDASGNLLVVANDSSRVDEASTDVWIAKLDRDGEPIWISVRDGAEEGTDWANGVATDSRDNILIAGAETRGGALDFAVWKLDGNGDEIWTRYYAASDQSTDIARALTLDGDDNVIAVGTEEKHATNNTDIVIHKLAR